MSLVGQYVWSVKSPAKILKNGVSKKKVVTIRLGAGQRLLERHDSRRVLLDGRIKLWVQIGLDEADVMSIRQLRLSQFSTGLQTTLSCI